MLNKAVEHMYELVTKDISDNIAGGDKLLKAADLCKDRMNELLNKMGLNKKTNMDDDNVLDYKILPSHVVGVIVVLITRKYW